MVGPGRREQTEWREGSRYQLGSNLNPHVSQSKTDLRKVPSCNLVSIEALREFDVPLRRCTVLLEPRNSVDQLRLDKSYEATKAVQAACCLG